MSRDEENEYFSDGLAEELLNVLAKIRGLRVAARTSSFHFKGKNPTIAEIGAALNVATVLEGSVRKAGNRVRISVQLVKVADGYHLWSETYDRTLDDIFVVQDDIARSVVKELRSTLIGKEADSKASGEAKADVEQAVRGRGESPEAQRLFLQARNLIERFNQEDMGRGIGYLEKALEVDPGYALAWAKLGHAYSRQGTWGWAPRLESFQRARDAVKRALSLDPDLVEGHAMMGWIQMTHDWDWHGAEASLGRALELEPRNALVLRWAGVLAGRLGRSEEAIGLYRRALEQDPLCAAAYLNLGIMLHAAGRLTEAEEALRMAVELNPGGVADHGYLSLDLLEQGRNEEALAEAVREPDEPFRLFVLAIVHHETGHRAESDEMLRRLIEGYPEHAPGMIAAVYAVRGEADEAFEWLERAYSLRDSELAEIHHVSFFRSLHGDPRWGAFLKTMGFEG
jgi:TolB-like protein/Tfp pilus assembly protein PilF